MNMNYATVPVLTTNTMVFSTEIILFDMAFFSKWWYQDRYDRITVWLDTYPELIHENGNCTLSYVRVDEFDEQSYKNKCLQMLGGQVHVQYDVHKLPLIISRHKTKCGCNWWQQYLCFSIATCKMFLCNKCFEEYD